MKSNLSLEASVAREVSSSLSDLEPQLQPDVILSLEGTASSLGSCVLSDILKLCLYNSLRDLKLPNVLSATDFPDFWGFLGSRGVLLGLESLDISGEPLSLNCCLAAWDSQALPCLSSLTLQGRDLMNSQAWYKRFPSLQPPQEGSNEGLIEIGYAYETGWKTSENPGTAEVFYEKAGHSLFNPSLAEFLIGQLYDIGSGASKRAVKNTEKAYQNYQRAADRGCGAAITHLGVMHQYGGSGHPPNYAKAAHVYQQAVELKDALAQVLLGTFYHHSLGGLPQDFIQAYHLYALAAQQNHPLGQAYCKIMRQEEGYQGPDTQDQSHSLLNLCALEDLNDVMALDTLGRLHERGYADFPAGPAADLKAYGFYHQAGERDFGPALYNLYRMNRDQRAQTADPHKGSFFCFRAAQRGSLEAQCAVAHHLKQSDYGPSATHDLEALKWYQQAAAQGLAKAKTHLASMYMHGQGVRADSAKAQALYQEAAHQGDRMARYCHTLNLLEAQRQHPPLKPSFDRYLAEAQHGDPVAQTLVGLMYSRGLGVKTDKKKAAHWNRAAAQQGFSMAQSNLAVQYAQGEGVRYRPERAARWFTLAAEQHLPVALYHLSLLHRHGVGVPPNHALALNYGRRAAAGAFAPAYKLIAQAYLEGKGVDHNDREALKALRLAADHHVAEAQYGLGMMYKQGRGVCQNDREAVGWLKAAAVQGYGPAQYQMGLMTLQGRGITPDVHNAACWFRWAAAQGDPDITAKLTWITQEKVFFIDSQGHAYEARGTPNGTLYIQAFGRSLEAVTLRPAPANRVVKPSLTARQLGRGGRLCSFTHETLPFKLQGVLMYGDPSQPQLQKSVKLILEGLDKPEKHEDLGIQVYTHLTNLGITTASLATVKATLLYLQALEPWHQKAETRKIVTTWINHAVGGESLCELLASAEAHRPEGPLRRMGTFLIAKTWYENLYDLSLEILEKAAYARAMEVIAACTSGTYGAAGTLFLRYGLPTFQNLLTQLKNTPPDDRGELIKEWLARLLYESEGEPAAIPLAKALNPDAPTDPDTPA